jgi:hypothetical protein
LVFETVGRCVANTAQPPHHNSWRTARTPMRFRKHLQSGGETIRFHVDKPPTADDTEMF